MPWPRPLARPALALLVSLPVAGLPPLMATTPAAAISLNPVCNTIALVSGIAGKACKAVQHGGRVLGAGKKLLGGHVGGALKTLTGQSAGAVAGKAAWVVGLAAIGDWVLGGARSALKLTAEAVDATTRPQLETTWFSATYWRIAGIAAVLTLPFVFAAAVQALLRSDVTLLVRAALGYLPLSLLAVSIAGPVIMLLLAATDELCAAVASAAGGASAHFLGRASLMSGLLTIRSGSPFVTFFLAVAVVGFAVVLWLEMVVREAAIYVVVLMLPLVFATMVWPARRVWVVRTAELLVALILSKFVIVAALCFGGEVLGVHVLPGAGGLMLGFALVVLATLAPWALVRLLPMAELGSTLAGLRPDAIATGHGRLALAAAHGAEHRIDALPALMQRQAEDAAGPGPGSADEPGKLADTASADPVGSAQASEAGAAGERMSAVDPQPQPLGESVAGEGASSPGAKREAMRAYLQIDGPTVELGAEAQQAARPEPQRSGSESPGSESEPPCPRPEPPRADPPAVDPDLLPPSPEPEDRTQ